MGRLHFNWGFPGGSEVKNPVASAGGTREVGLIPELGRSREEEMEPTFLPGKPHGASPCGHKLSDITEHTVSIKKNSVFNNFMEV